MAPQLNEALNELKEPDRDALILRFFESKTMAQVGSALGTSEGAAKMRLARALDQLRGIFQARGIAIPVTSLATALSTSTTQAAPVGPAASTTASALLKTTPIPLLTKGLLLFKNLNARKLAITAIVVLSLTTVTTTALLAVWLWKPSPPVAATTAPAPPELEQEVVLGLDDGAANVKRGKDGTLRVTTAAGDLIVTNVVNYFVTKDDQGRTKEVTITTNENGGGRRIWRGRRST